VWNISLKLSDLLYTTGVPEQTLTTSKTSVRQRSGQTHEADRQHARGLGTQPQLRFQRRVKNKGELSRPESRPQAQSGQGRPAGTPRSVVQGLAVLVHASDEELEDPAVRGLVLHNMRCCILQLLRGLKGMVHLRSACVRLMTQLLLPGWALRHCSCTA
jgi:hypothetical protein